MTVIPITCDNCGAKYKLPESFKGHQAKCQKCGSVIDVAMQRSAPAESGGPTPVLLPAAAARPAIDRSKMEWPPSPAAAVIKAPSQPATAPARTGQRRGVEADEGGHRGRPGEKKNNMVPLAIGAIGLVAIVFVAFVMLGGDDKPATGNTAQTDATAKSPAAPTGKPGTKPTEQAAAPNAPAKTAQAPAGSTGPRKPWENIKGITSLADVSDPRSFPEVVWPASIDDAKKTEVRRLCDEVQRGGATGTRAKQRLGELRFEAMFAVVEKLRDLDYRLPEDSMAALEFNKLLEEVTGGLSAGFAAVEAGERIDPRKAEYNTLTVGKWRNVLADMRDAEAFEKRRAERLKKQTDDGK